MGSQSSLSENEKDIFTLPIGRDFYSSNISSKDITLQQNGYHHRSDIRWSCIAYSDSHRLIAVGSASGMVIVLGRDAVHRFQVDKQEAVVWLGFIRLELCAATRGGRLVFWDLLKKRRLRALEPLTLSEITSVCVVPKSNSRFIVFGHFDGKVRFYDSLKKRPCSLFVPVLTSVGGLDPSSVLCAEFCPTQCNKLLIAYNTEPWIFLYNFVTREIHPLSKHQQSKYRVPSICRTLALSKKQSVFIAGCDDGSICVFRFSELAPLKTIFLNRNPKLTPIYQLAMHELLGCKDSAEKSLYVSGGWSSAEKTSGVVRLDLSLPLKGEVEQKSRMAITPLSGRTSDFCLHRKLKVESNVQDYTELITQNVEGEVKLFAKEYSKQDSDEEDEKINETRRCSLFHTELQDVVDMSLCCGTGEELKDFCPFERTTPLNLLGGDLLFEWEYDFLVTGHSSGLCILWKVSRREYFNKILEIDVLKLINGNDSNVMDGKRISAVNLFGRIITVGMQSGDVVEIKLSGVQKDGSKILWESNILKKVHNNAVVYIKRSQNVLVIVDKSSLTSVLTPYGELVSIFAALDGFDSDKDLRITHVSIQPSVLIDQSVIYFGFSNGAWGLFDFSGNKTSFGPLAENKFKTAITYIARLNHKGELSKCKPYPLPLQQVDMTAGDSESARIPTFGSVCLTNISSKILAQEGSHLDGGAPTEDNLPRVIERKVDKEETLKSKTVLSQNALSEEKDVKSSPNNMTVPSHGRKNIIRRGGSCDSFLFSSLNEISDDWVQLSAPNTPVSKKRKKKSRMKKIKGFVRKGGKKEYLDPVTFWSRETGFASQEQDSMTFWSREAVAASQEEDSFLGEAGNKTVIKQDRATELSDSKEQCLEKKVDQVVNTTSPKINIVQEEKKEPTEEYQNGAQEESYEEIIDNYLVICSRNKVVVIQITLPDFKICGRYSFQSPLLGAQVLSKEPGKVGLATISENGRCNIFRLMDLHILQSTVMKIPMLINMVMLPAGRYVAVSKSMEFYHGGFFESPVKLSFDLRSEVKSASDQQAHHKKQGSGLFSMFSRKSGIVNDNWDDALEILEESKSSHRHIMTPPTRTAPKAKHRHMLSEPARKRKAPSSGQKTLGSENLEKMNERGEMISKLGDKSAQMNESAQRFSNLAQQLRKKNQSWF